MNCKQVEELLPLYAGRDLDEKRASVVTQHLQTCAACARVADEYRESVQLTEQFAPPVFSEAVYAGIRQRVLSEIETKATAPVWSQTAASWFRPGLTWAIASVLLIVVSMFAIYFITKRGNVEQQVAHQPPANVQPGTKERADSAPPDNQQLAGAPQLQRRKRSRAARVSSVAAKSPDATSTVNTVSPQPSSLPEPTLFPHRDSAASVKPLRVEIQTKDPMIRIIWFVQPETKPVIPGSKGT